MIIGKIGYLSKENDKAYIRVLSREMFLEQVNFVPSLVTFEIWLDKLICIENIDTPSILSFFEFNPEIHQQYLDFDNIRAKSGGISIRNNTSILDFIIDNELDDRQNQKLIELKAVKKMIDYRPGYPSHYVKAQNIDLFVEQYNIHYSESGYNKPGDWSRASITIYTNQPHNLPSHKLDPYLQRLLPKFEFCLGSGDDSEECKFKSDILRKLRNEIGPEKLDTIKKLCSELTNNVKLFALMVYREEEHALALWHYCSKLRTEIKNEYKLIR